jgi:hypothetical protein
MFDGYLRMWSARKQSSSVLSIASSSALARVVSWVPLRLETGDRNYSFMAFESGDNKTATLRNTSSETAGAANQALFDLAYRLYAEDLKTR